MFDFFKKNLVNSTPLWLYCKIINIRSIIRKKKHRIFPIKGQVNKYSEIHEVRVEDQRIYLCRRGRNNMHKHGITHRINNLANDYLLGDLMNLSNGTLIDCGANIGELGIWAQHQKMHYIAFEPESLEAECCDRNNFNGKAITHRFALWKENETLSFYSRASSADSSLLPSGHDDNVIHMEAKRLDSVLSQNDLHHPIVLKVEAEGAEPEVLEGSTGLIPFCDYITVDCGYERGDKNDPKHTFIETNKILSKHGFIILEANLRRGTFLFGKESNISNRKNFESF